VQRRGDRGRQQRCLGRDRVGGLGGLGQPVPPREEVSHAVLESREERENVRIGGWLSDGVPSCAGSDLDEIPGLR